MLLRTIYLVAAAMILAASGGIAFAEGPGDPTAVKSDEGKYMDKDGDPTFKVAPDGTVEVTLAQPTPNPRLNQILLNVLKEWRFFPAMKDGIAINSEFDVRIPISVQ